MTHRHSVSSPQYQPGRLYAREDGGTSRSAEGALCLDDEADGMHFFQEKVYCCLSQGAFWFLSLPLFVFSSLPLFDSSFLPLFVFLSLSLFVSLTLSLLVFHPFARFVSKTVLHQRTPLRERSVKVNVGGKVRGGGKGIE